MKYFVAPIVCSVLLSACVYGKMLTPTDIEQYGTRKYDAPVEKVFPAVVKALEMDGYEVPIQNVEKGMVRTGRKVVSASGARGYAVSNTRQYYVEIHVEGGKTVVSARPLVFSGEQDLSEGAVWLIDGPYGEEKLWNRLFQNVSDQL